MVAAAASGPETSQRSGLSEERYRLMAEEALLPVPRGVKEDKNCRR